VLLALKLLDIEMLVLAVLMNHWYADRLVRMDDLKSETVTTSTPKASGSSAQVRRGRKRSSTTSEHCKTRRRNSSQLSHSLASSDSAILESDDDFGQYVARELKMIDNVRARQFAKLQIHSILFNSQFDVTSIPPDVIHSLVTSQQSFNSHMPSSALNNQFTDFSNT